MNISRTTWHALAWKEWHEHKWKLAALTAIVLGVSTVPLYWHDSNTLPACIIITVFCIAPLALFMGASEATSERSLGTESFTRALPIPSWKVACCKLAAGWLTCVTPVIAGLIVCIGVYLLHLYLRGAPWPHLTDPFTQTEGSLRPGAWLTFGTLSGIAMATGIFLWSAAIGVRCKDEIRAAAWSLLIIVAWWTAMTMIPFIVRPPVAWAERFIPPALAISPGGLATYLLNRTDNPHPWITLFLGLAALLAVALAFLVRYSRSSEWDVASRRPAATRQRNDGWLAPPRSTQLTALAWKQCRESAPIVIAGLAAILGIVAICYLINRERLNTSFAGQVIAGVSAYVGAVITLVVGIGVFLNDLSPGLNAFWRSRPINPNGWFWTKYLMGLVVLAVAFSIPFAVAAMLESVQREFTLSKTTPAMLLAPLWIYSAAILMTCIVRHAVYAGILSAGVMYLAALLIVGTIRLAKFGLGQIAWADISNPTLGELATTMFISTIAFTILAWLAVRYGWGRQSRY